MRGRYQKRRSGTPTLCFLLLVSAICFSLAAAPTMDEPEPVDPPAVLPPFLLTGSLENGSPFPVQPLPVIRPEESTETWPADLPAVKTVTQNGGTADTVYLANESKFDLNPKELMMLDNPTAFSGAGIEVLILHTHGTEAYTPSDGLVYAASEEDRTLDPDYSVIRVGTELQRVLESYGIGVVHSTALHDYPAYSGSYDRALDDIEAWVEKHPGIRVIIDLHRDSIVSTSGTKYKTAAVINGESTAQLMFVAGTDGGGLRHDGWESNLALQLRLHAALNTKYPGLMRPLNIRNARFNQHVTPGSMLLEVGTSGNSLTEALNAVHLFGEVLADQLLEQ